MKWFFGLLFTLSLVGLAPTADAACYALNPAPTGSRDVFIEVPPVAVADASGVVTVTTPTGGTLQVSGFAPGAEVCRNLLFKSASAKCTNGKAKLDNVRHPKFCKGVNPGGTCVHIVCDKRT